MKNNCLICKKEFYVRPSRIKNGIGKFCSVKCLGIWRSKNKVGKNNPNWKEKIKKVCMTCEKIFYVKPSLIKNGYSKFCSAKCYGIWQTKNSGGRIKRICQTCGKDFFIIPAYAKKGGRFCSRKCFGIWASKNLKGRKGYNWKGGKIKNICKQCCKEYYIVPSEIKRGHGIFCSKKCKGMWMSKNRIKDKHPSWLGGLSFEPYTLDWTKTLRNKIRERDHYTCKICGKIQKYRAFSVHHIDYNKKNCNSDNLITLCAQCHTKTNRNREYWQNKLKDILTAKFT